jgi:hypothetical protein
MNGENDQIVRIATVEAKVSTLDTNLHDLAVDVKDLASIVRTQGENIETQIQQLMVAVTNAASPHKIDWSSMIALIVLLMAIGAAALSPLYLRIGDLQHESQVLDERFKAHEQLKLHPVGEAKIEYLEKTTALQVDTAAKAILALDVKLQKEGQLINDTLKEQMTSMNHSVAELDIRLQREFTMANETIKNTALVLEKTTNERIDTLDKLSIQRHDSLMKDLDVLLSRVVVLEINEKNRDKSDLDELRQRRTQSLICPPIK